MSRKRRNTANRRSGTSASRRRFSAQIPVGDFYGELKVVPVPVVNGSETDSELEALRDGSPGQYEVTYVLTTPGTGVVGGTTTEKVTESGDSVLQFPPGLPGIAIEFWDDTRRVEARCYPNRRRRLAKVQILFSASCRGEAEKLAFDLIIPMLSWLSYRYDVPLDVKACVVVEVSTEVAGYTINVQGKPRELQVGEQWTSRKPFRAVLSSYREAMNSTNVFYQALCYYKVIEGCYKLRDTRRKSTLDSGAQWLQPNEEVPSTQDGLPDFAKRQAEALQPYFGRKFRAVQGDLRKVIRNAVAHLDPFGDSLMIDRYDDVDKCREAIPVLRLISRTLIDNEMMGAVDPAVD